MKHQPHSKIDVGLVPRCQLIVWCLACSCLSLSAVANCAPVRAASQSQPTNHSQSTNHPQHLMTVGSARQDSAYRYLAEKGADLFKDGRFVEAEKYYRAALSNAEDQGVHDRRLAMLVTNLATDLRQQQRYEEAEPLFERAVEIERKTTAKDNELMVYTAKQYAALLRETARDASAEAILASAHNGFAMMPVIKTTRTTNESESGGANGAGGTEGAEGTDRSDRLESGASGAETDRRNELSADLHHQHSAPYVVIVQPSSLTPTPTFSPTPKPELSVTAELKMLADIERSYQNQAAQSMQMLPSRFSYINSAPLYSTPGSGTVYMGGGIVGSAPSFAHGYRVSGRRL